TELVAAAAAASTRTPKINCGISSARSLHLLDDLVRPEQERLRHRESERLGGLEVDDQLELGRLLDGQIPGLRTLENLVHVGGGAAVQVRKVRAIGHETPGIHSLPPRVHCRQPVLCRQVYEASALIEEHDARQDSQSACASPGH